MPFQRAFGGSRSGQRKWRVILDGVRSPRHEAFPSKRAGFPVPGEVGIQDKGIGRSFGQGDVVVSVRGILGGGYGSEVDF